MSEEFPSGPLQRIVRQQLDIVPDPIVEAVRQRLDSRSAAGMRKYGTTMARTDLSRLDWLRHAQEELLDGAVYLERAIADELAECKRRCLAEWDNVNDSPCHPGDQGWAPCSVCLLSNAAFSGSGTTRQQESEGLSPESAVTHS